MISSHAHHMYSMSSLQAMEWLIQHQGDVDIDDPIPQPPPTNNSQELCPLKDTPSVAADINKGATEGSPGAQKSDEHSTKVNKTQKHTRRRKWEFVPDQVVSYVCIQR